MAYVLMQREGKAATRRTLDSSGLKVGRGEGNEIKLGEDSTVSRKHAELTLEGERCYVKDLGSRSGTRVNGNPIAGRVEIHRGDRISVGRTTMILLDEGDPEPAPLASSGTSGAGPSADRGRVLDEAFLAAPAESTATVSIPLSEIVGTTPAGALPGAPSALDVASRSRAFEILSRASETFLALQSLEAVFDMTLDMTHAAAAPDRAAVMLLEGSPPTLEMRAHRGRAGGGTGADGGAIAISGTIARAVLQERTAVLTSDATIDPRFLGAASVVVQGVRSAMCVPLWNNKEVIGLIYVDRVSTLAPYAAQDLRVLTLVANLAAIKIENVRLFVRDQEMKELEREMATAARIQQRLLPASAPPFAGYELAGRNVPCLAVGGDYFDMQVRENGRLALVIGDVSGKGLGAALLMALVQGAFRAHLPGFSSLPELVASLNHVVLTNSGDEQFMTLFCCEIDEGTGRLVFVNAGHNPPFLLRRNGPMERLYSRGMALGLLPGVRFDQAEVVLEEGDLVALYSDGITESQDTSSAEFGEERLVEVLTTRREEPAGDILEAILASALAFAGPAPQFDDMTLVVVRRQPSEGS